ncbi:L domain-like protein [Athelia psychrophila]|uniref:L domain-like protein n=1 Tax=Athelia psychrophila TaxID=1759441 RepID=A0A166RMV9_9AGAM|nr:L domain-like protein [Fibularhizoctonia sp. CBS 109695]
MQDLPVWPPLHIAKHPQPHPAELRKEEKRGRRNRSLIILLIIIILLLASASTFSLVRVLSPRSSSTSSTSTSATQRDISACLSQYTLNAPIAPTSFPCSTCAPLFSPAPTSPALSTADNSTASALLQFCALADIFAAASTSAQANLTNPGGWLTDTNFCSWAGVGCSSTAGTGVVTSLQLTTPGIPSVLSESIGQLAALETFALAGSGSLPAGPLPSSFAGLVGIKTLNIQDTSLTWNDTTGVTDMHGLQEVVLMQNAKINALPTGLSSSSVQSIVINNQPISSTTLSDIANSASLQVSLQLLDLSSTPLNTTLPSLASFHALTELHLDNTGLEGPLPGAGGFPPSLTVLSMTGNTGLATSDGIGGVCVYAASSSALQTCTLGGTGLSAPSGRCGVCTF